MKEVVKRFPEDLDKRTEYMMMEDSKRMIDAEGSVLNVKAWINYVDDAGDHSPEFTEKLVLKTEDGEVFGTISQTFINKFKDMVEHFGDDIGAIKVFTRQSKQGRTYVTCTVA